MVQWLSAWLKTDGLGVRASTASQCCVLQQNTCTGSTQEDPSWNNWKLLTVKESKKCVKFICINTWFFWKVEIHQAVYTNHDNLSIIYNFILFRFCFCLICIGAILVSNFVCLLMRIIVSFLRYTRFSKCHKRFISHVLLLILVHVPLLSSLCLWLLVSLRSKTLFIKYCGTVY